eukprot:g6650.t1
MGPPLQVSVTAVFAAVAALNFIGMLVFANWIPPSGETESGGMNELVADCKGCRPLPKQCRSFVSSLDLCRVGTGSPSFGTIHWPLQSTPLL